MEENLDKCEVIPTAGRDSHCDLSAFPAAVLRRADGCFKLLGAPVGGREHCEQFVLEKRVQKVTAMLEEVPSLEDAQVAHKLLSRCFGASRLMHNMRTSRPDWMSAGLEASERALRSTLQTCTGTAVSDDQWRQAALPLSKGGLGLRCGPSHAAAAYLASRSATRLLCCQIDPAFEWEGAKDGSAVAAAMGLYNEGVCQEHRLDDTSFSAEGNTLGQRDLSRKVDATTLDNLTAASSDAHKARLRAVSAPHAGAWLQAQPCSALGQRMAHCEFVAALRLWLGCAASSRDDWCPKCDQVMDALGLHAFSCMAGGDAVKLHNALRDFVHAFAHLAGLRAEKEESGLLPDDPRRRPGDVYFPTWPLGPPLALDFAVTSPLRQSEVQTAAKRQLSAATAYEGAKLADRDTCARCEQHGIRLVPVVAESFGGWGGMAQDLFRTLIHARAARSGETVSSVTTSLYTGLSIILMRANARALLARVPQEAGVHADRVSRAATLLQAGRSKE